MADESDYSVWRALLRGARPEVNPDNPQPGFYRVRKVKGGPFVPLAYWFADGALVCVLDGAAIPETRGRELWQWACSNPVENSVYNAVVAGGQWPDIDPTVAAAKEEKRHGMGGNNPPEDEVLLLQEQIDAAAAGVSAYAKITDDETQRKAQTLRSWLLELSGTADKKREAEKKPHWDAAKAVDAKWQPLVKRAKELADKIRDAMGVYETAKLRAEREAAAKAEAERRAHEEAARKAALANEPAPPPPAPPPAPAPTASAPIKGAAGRAATTKLVKVVTVTDQDAVYAYMKTRPEVVELLGRLAQRAVDAGHDVPGVSIEEQRRVA